MQAGRYTEITVIGKGVTTATRRGCLERIYRNCENIADAAFGLNDARRSRIDLQLAPQSSAVGLAVLPMSIFPARRENIGRQPGVAAYVFESCSLGSVWLCGPARAEPHQFPTTTIVTKRLRRIRISADPRQRPVPEHFLRVVRWKCAPNRRTVRTHDRHRSLSR